MNEYEFEKHFTRIQDQWPRGFSEQRIKLIWRAVKWLHAHEFSQVVDDVVGNNRFSPVVADFEKACAKIRETRRTDDRHRERKEVEDAWVTNVTPDEAQNICGEIKRNISGRMSKEDRVGFTDLLKGMGKTPKGE